MTRDDKISRLQEQLEEQQRRLEQERTERERTEAELRESQERLLKAQRVARMGFLDLIPKDYEFQMLLGVDEMLRDILVDAGHRLRVYIPFGKRWYEYSMRRLKENPRIAGYIMKNLLNGLKSAGNSEVEPPGLDLRRSREP